MSDQDFFFDEEEKPVAPAKGAMTGAKTVAKGAAQPVSAVGVPFFDQSVSMTVASLAAVCALLLGVIVGFAVKPAGISVPAAVSGGTGGAGAPQLSEEQLGSGQLPAGHPDIAGGQGGATATTGTK
ncbi:MAG: hypothetical protein C0418_04940 [Coriobacteriaceae bacterium]|nr:hypothetical protein [Coriobacteriaceae bacterium]